MVGPLTPVEQRLPAVVAPFFTAFGEDEDVRSSEDSHGDAGELHGLPLGIEMGLEQKRGRKRPRYLYESFVLEINSE
jgi:hypothetical protein